MRIWINYLRMKNSYKGLEMGLKMLKKYRAFAKKNREMFIWIDRNIFRIETVQEILKEWGVSKAKYFKYYGKKYSVVFLGNDLFKNWKRKYQIHR